MKFTHPSLGVGPVNFLTQVNLKTAIAMFEMRLKALNRSPGTIEWYGKCLPPLVARFEGKELGGISKGDIFEYLVYLQSRYHPATVSRYFIGIKTFFGCLKADGLITEDPTASIEAPRRPKRIIRPLSKEQTSALLSQVKLKGFYGIRNYAMVAFMLDAMARVSETINLKSADIDWSGQQARIVGKGDKERVVPFGSECKRAMLRYWAVRKSLENQPLFFVSHFGQKIARHWVSELVGRLGDRIGVRTTPHLLRHTGATEYIRNGGDPVSLKSILGHSTLDTVMIYVHLADKDVSAKHRMFSPMDNLGVRKRKVF